MIVNRISETEKTMNCIVIKKLQEASTLVDFINLVPYFELSAVCNSVFEAYEILQREQIDLIFLDTDLPKISGIEFIKSLNNKPLFIFTSSDVNLAIEGFNLNAIDFLLKPFSFERFLRATNKAFLNFSIQEKRTFAERANIDKPGQLNDFMLVKADYQTLSIKLDNILYIEGLKDYIKIYTSKNAKPIVTLNSLKKLQQKLPSNRFSRVHKSYIIGLEHIKSINKSQVIINDKYIPIGESFKNIFISKMEDLKI